MPTAIAIFTLACYAAAISAVLALDVSIPLKALLVALGGILLLLLKALAEVINEIHRLYIYVRLTFISTEMKRTEPEKNRESAWDRLKDDFENERMKSEDHKNLSPFMHYANSITGWIFTIGLLGCGVVIFYHVLLRLSP
jgi:hypothetical protein